MLQTGIFNPHLLSLLARVRHTNTLVIADVGFPYWPNVETVDLSLTADIPSVPDVLRALQSNFKHGHVWMAAEFLEHNALPVHARFQSLVSVPIGYEPHIEFKRRVPQAIGLIRTADTTPYANIILESA